MVEASFPGGVCAAILVRAGRCSCYKKKSKDWPHGFLELELGPGMVLERYHLENGELFERHLRQSEGRWVYSTTAEPASGSTKDVEPADNLVRDSA